MLTVDLQFLPFGIILWTLVLSAVVFIRVADTQETRLVGIRVAVILQRFDDDVLSPVETAIFVGVDLRGTIVAEFSCVTSFHVDDGLLAESDCCRP